MNDEFQKVLPLMPCSFMTKENCEKEQPGLQEIKCPDCGRDCWISKKKRDLLELNNDIKVYCLICIKEEADRFRSNGIEPDIQIWRIDDDKFRTVN